VSAVAIVDLCKAYGQVKALDHVTLDVSEGEFFGLLGPSGSGKTTLLRAIAGFVEPDAGEIRIDRAPVVDIPVHRRSIGMVFQSYALFPHLSVFDNVAFGLEVRGMRREEVRSSVLEMLALVRLEGFEGRRPRELSGGQQQRVALARALVTRPRVLLLDEPLGALDKRLRQEMQIELKQIQREVGITTLFVTHDQEEALTLSDRIAIIDEGRIVQVGPPMEVYERPATVFAAGFLGDANLFSGEVEGMAEGFGLLRLADGSLLRAPGLAGQGRATLAVRPEKLRLIDRSETAPADVNRLDGRVLRWIYSGNSISYRIEAANQELIVFEQNRDRTPLPAGTDISLVWAPEHSHPVAP
jgi:spermidine/putrescine ABC transporter ATP-binding subunit